MSDARLVQLVMQRLHLGSFVYPSAGSQRALGSAAFHAKQQCRSSRFRLTAGRIGFPRLRCVDDDPLERLALMLAPLVAEAMGGPNPFLDAAQVARRYGVDRGWVYDHADELGVIRLGGGPRPRLRFDPHVVDQAMRDARQPGGSRSRTHRARKRNKSATGRVELLPIGPAGGVGSSSGRRID